MGIDNGIDALQEVPSELAASATQSHSEDTMSWEVGSHQTPNMLILQPQTPQHQEVRESIPLACSHPFSSVRGEEVID